MGNVQLPKDALQRVQLGQSFAEYDIIRKHISKSITIVPQIFDLLRLPLQHEEFLDTR